DDLDQSPRQRHFDGRIGASLDADRPAGTPPAEQHVDHRVDEVGVDGQKTIIVPLLRLDDGEDGRQRDRVEIVPKRTEEIESIETSTLSEVKLRRLVVASRTSRSKTISSIGRR